MQCILYFVILYLVVEQEWLNRRNKVGIHIGQYTAMGGIHRSMPAMASEMPDVIYCISQAQDRFQIPEYKINQEKKANMMLQPGFPA